MTTALRLTPGNCLSSATPSTAHKYAIFSSPGRTGCGIHLSASRSSYAECGNAGFEHGGNSKGSVPDGGSSLAYGECEDEAKWDKPKGERVSRSRRGRKERAGCRRLPHRLRGEVMRRRGWEGYPGWRTHLDREGSSVATGGSRFGWRPLGTSSGRSCTLDASRRVIAIWESFFILIMAGHAILYVSPKHVNYPRVNSVNHTIFGLRTNWDHTKRRKKLQTNPANPTPARRRRTGSESCGHNASQLHRATIPKKLSPFGAELSRR